MFFECIFIKNELFVITNKKMSFPAFCLSQKTYFLHVMPFKKQLLTVINYTNYTINLVQSNSIQQRNYNQPLRRSLT